MTKPKKEDYLPEIERLKQQISEAISDLEFTKDICIHARTDEKFHRKNWIAELLFVKGTLESLRDNLEDME